MKEQNQSTTPPTPPPAFDQERFYQTQKQKEIFARAILHYGTSPVVVESVNYEEEREHLLRLFDGVWAGF